MKVMLIEPDKVAIMKSPPLGLAYVAAVLEREHDVSIVPRPTFDMTLDDVKRTLEKEAPDVVGMTCVTMTASEVLKIAALCKQVFPNTVTVVGGIHPTFAYPQMLHRGCIDYIVRFEGEHTMPDLLQHLDNPSQVRGIAYLKDNELVVTPERPFIENLDELPFPARHLLPMHIYEKYSKGNMLSSRGCPYDCLYCSLVRFIGRKFRVASPERVLEEIKHLVHEYKVNFVDFVDASFTINRHRTQKICSLIKKEELNITWRCSSRVDQVTEELLDIMSESGCVSIFYGVESGVEEILNRSGKKTPVEEIKNAFKWSKERNIKTTASYIIGLPGETMETALKTLSLIRELESDEVSPGIFYPFPGTDVYYNPEKYGIQVLYGETPPFDTLCTPAIKTKELDENQLRDLFAEGVFFGKKRSVKGNTHESHCS
ncbi:MAG: cobalamin B12-binding domain-containing protein [Theionarchaea archaeon]|nr:cobalamin B12-binding domain-containing protein [Theionarchaea archaeon]